MREEKIFANNVQTNCKIVGSGPTLLILHGWGGSSDTWVKVIDILKTHFQIICPDLPGFGKSSPPPFAWKLDDFKLWLNDIFNKFSIEKAILLGHSFGGRVAVKFSLSFPEKVEILVLCASAGIKTKMGIKERIIFLSSFLGKKIFSFAPVSPFEGIARKVFYFVIRNKDYAKASKRMREIMKNVLKEDLLLELSQIKNKTIIFWGEKDKILPLPQAYLFYRSILNSQLFILPDIGHSPNLQNPKLFAEVLISALKKELS